MEFVVNFCICIAFVETYIRRIDFHLIKLYEMVRIFLEVLKFYTSNILNRKQTTWGKQYRPPT